MKLEPGELLLELRNLEAAQAAGSRGVVLNKDYRGAHASRCISRYEAVAGVVSKP